ncbi:pyruvate, water dikinase regulatory protein [Paenibacillus sp. HW567]|uniref:pyruvate, water dikinase regulatory protein n=1 Tax=Paenibacillus sp. HW567 TaxID=1034769 RepID=UPI00035C9F1C|nr:pyruvate, water dikinase regulatory protein [Paenibacillus sp. HW567]
MIVPEIYICSDSVGETGDTVVKAALRQFDIRAAGIKHFRRISSEREIREIVELAAQSQSVIVYTLVEMSLREAIQRQSTYHQVQAVDIMGPVIEAISGAFHNPPLLRPGRRHELDAAYYSRIEAIEFAVKYDDGRDARGIALADIVLIGVSRTSKTPLSMYLAYKGYKVANWPLTLHGPTPPEIMKIPRNRIFGLTMDMEALIRIRTERLRALGLGTHAGYASELQVLEESIHADSLMKQLGCTIIDVTNKSIEESAGLILESIQ